MLGFVPPMLKTFENPVTMASSLLTLGIKKLTNFLLWHTRRWFREDSRHWWYRDAQDTITPPSSTCHSVSYQTLNCNHEAYLQYIVPITYEHFIALVIPLALLPPLYLIKSYWFNAHFQFHLCCTTCPTSLIFTQSSSILLLNLKIYVTQHRSYNCS